MNSCPHCGARRHVDRHQYDCRTSFAVPANRGTECRSRSEIQGLRKERDALKAAVGELNERLHERTQGFLRRAEMDRRELGAAWFVINDLMKPGAQGRAEPMVAGLEWLVKNEGLTGPWPRLEWKHSQPKEGA